MQTFLVGYVATTLLVDRAVPTDAIVYGSLLGFVTVPVVGMPGDRFGRRPMYAMLVAYSLITLVATVLSPETRGRDLVRLEDAA